MSRRGLDLGLMRQYVLVHRTGHVAASAVPKQARLKHLPGAIERGMLLETGGRGCPASFRGYTHHEDSEIMRFTLAVERGKAVVTGVYFDHATPPEPSEKR